MLVSRRLGVTNVMSSDCAISQLSLFSHGPLIYGLFHLAPVKSTILVVLSVLNLFHDGENSISESSTTAMLLTSTWSYQRVLSNLSCGLGSIMDVDQQSLGYRGDECSELSLRLYFQMEITHDIQAIHDYRQLDVHTYNTLLIHHHSPITKRGRFHSL